MKTALQDASSVAGMLLTAEVAITDIPQPPAPMGGGGGGMPGLDFKVYSMIMIIDSGHDHDHLHDHRCSFVRIIDHWS